MPLRPTPLFWVHAYKVGCLWGGLETPDTPACVALWHPAARELVSRSTGVPSQRAAPTRGSRPGGLGPSHLLFPGTPPALVGPLVKGAPQRQSQSQG